MVHVTVRKVVLVGAACSVIRKTNSEAQRQKKPLRSRRAFHATQHRTMINFEKRTNAEGAPPTDTLCASRKQELHGRLLLCCFRRGVIIHKGVRGGQGYIAYMKVHPYRTTTRTSARSIKPQVHLLASVFTQSQQGDWR